jgi:predicted anti-sigma-YlaC factor YlaD
VGNELWAWAGLAAGLVAILGAFTTGTGAIGPWLTSTVHRVTEFSALTGWWIVAMWAVVASASLAANSGGPPVEDDRTAAGPRHRPRHRHRDPGSGVPAVMAATE